MTDVVGDADDTTDKAGAGAGEAESASASAVETVHESDSETEPDPQTADDDEGRARRPLVLLTVALLVIATGLGAAAATFYSRLQSERSDRDEVSDVAGRFGQALLSYDYTDLEATKRRVRAEATPRWFSTEFERAFSGGLDVLLRETRGRSRATVIDVFVSDIEADTTSALVSLRAEAEGIRGRQPVSDSYLQLDLVKVDGRWKVDQVTNLNFGQSQTPRASTPTAPSTVPPPP